VNIIQALDNDDLFAQHFRGDTWKPWRAFLKALFGLPMADTDLELFRHHTGRTEPPATPSTEAAVVTGRRGGKSRMLALIATYLSTFRDYTQYLAPGEVATCAIIAADRRQARSIFRFVMGLLESVPMLGAMIEDSTAERIVLSNRVVIEIHTASFRVTRGYTFLAVLADETAFWRDELSAVPDIEIFRALRPGLANIPGAMLLNASSPYARRGVLWSTYKAHFGRDDSRILVWQATTAEMNATIDPAIIAEAYEDDPEAASAEYGAQFRSDLAAFVDRAVVEACTVANRYEIPPVPGQQYSAFIDPSGGSSDSMTLAIAHKDRGTDVAILDAVREQRPPFSPENVVEDFARLMKSYGITKVVGDRFAGEWVRQPFQQYGITYNLADRSKSDLYRDCLPLLNSGRVELLDLPRLMNQLCALERRVSRAGRDSIDHPPNSHDDVANASCGALLLSKVRNEWQTQTLNSFWRGEKPGEERYRRDYNIWTPL
jgi:hypothetical protein